MWVDMFTVHMRVLSLFLDPWDAAQWAVIGGTVNRGATECGVGRVPEVFGLMQILRGLLHQSTAASEIFRTVLPHILSWGSYFYRCIPPLLLLLPPLLPQLTSHTRHHTLDITHSTSHTPYHTLNITLSRHHTLDITHPTSHTRHHTTDITHSTSHTPYHTLNITLSTSHTRYHKPNITHSTSHN